MITIEAYPNYMGAGRWHFEADVLSGHYELDLYPHLLFYSILLPDGKSEQGFIPELQLRLQFIHQDEELYMWLSEALNFYKSDPELLRIYKWMLLNVITDTLQTQVLKCICN